MHQQYIFWILSFTAICYHLIISVLCAHMTWCTCAQRRAFECRSFHSTLLRECWYFCLHVPTSQQLALSFLTVLLSLSPAHNRSAGVTDVRPYIWPAFFLLPYLPLSLFLFFWGTGSPDCPGTHTVDQLASNSEISSPLPPECWD